MFLPTKNVQNIRMKPSMGLLITFLFLFTVLSSSLTSAVYDAKSHKIENGASRNGPSTKDVSFEETVSTTKNLNTVAWDHIVKKYSTVERGLTREDVIRVANSMQKCQNNQKSGKTPVGEDSTKVEVTNTIPVEAELASSEKFPAVATQVSNCNKIMDSMTAVQDKQTIFNESSFKEICPRLLYIIENEECCALRNKNDTTSQKTISDARNLLKKEKPTSSEVWGYGILLVTIISCSSLVGVSLMPFMAKDFYKHLLTVMIGLAVGSLTGSAVFHLLPQALRLDAGGNREYLHISLVIVGGIWLFFMVERILKFIMDYKERKGKNWKREKMTSILAGTPESSGISVMTENGNVMKGAIVMEQTGEQRNSLIFSSMPRDTDVIYESQEQVIKASFGHQEKPRASNCHDHQVTFEQGKDSVIATVAWMIIFGDGLHNFIDGLSIGAAFNESIWTGVSISVAVLCEELPHELGDFAVLLNAGMSMRQAVTYNFLSACTCYIGMAVGILLGEIEASIYIFALAGGMFLYISLVDMVPEMNEIAQETSKISVKNGLITLLLQNIGLFTGITTLYMLALYQDSFQF